MKSVNTSNLKSGLEYTSNAKLIEIQNLSAQPNEIIVGSRSITRQRY
jgi:hypothetical protein